MATLSLRNTFRRPARVSLTVLTLVTAGAIFIVVMSTQHSFNATINRVSTGIGFQVQVGFEQDQRFEEILPLIESRPNVQFAELWLNRSGEAYVPGTSGSSSREEISLRSFPRNSQLFDLEMVGGRMLNENDGQAMLLNQKLARQMDVGVGDLIIVDLGDAGESTWTIVGLVFELSGRDQETAFVYIDSLNHVLHQAGVGSVVLVRGIESTFEMQKAIEHDMIELFESRGIGIAFTNTAIDSQSEASAQFQVLTNVLLVMTVLIAVVGSIALSGTLSINIIERRREIGVMRAVGASSVDVGVIFAGEGLMLGLLSWLIAVPIGILMGPLFVTILGDVIDFPAIYEPSYSGIWIWLIIVFILSLLASWLPSRRATRISVQDSLAYE